MDGPMLSPRFTDQFGRYRRLLYPGVFTLKASSRGYETYVEQGIVPSISSFTVRDIALVPLPEYSVSFDFSFPDDYVDSFNTPIQLTYKDQWGEVTQDILPGTVLNLYEGFYEIEIKDPNSNFIMPISDAFYL